MHKTSIEQATKIQSRIQSIDNQSKQDSIEDLLNRYSKQARFNLYSAKLYSLHFILIK